MQKPINFDQIWLEDRDKEEVIPADLFNVYLGRFGFKTCDSWNFFFADHIDYGSRWRAWAHKPTDEERKDAEWR